MFEYGYNERRLLSSGMTPCMIRIFSCVFFFVLVTEVAGNSETHISDVTEF